MVVNGLVALTFMFLSLIPAVYGMFYSHLALRRKGYESPLIQQYIVFAYLGAWIAVWLGAAFLAPRGHEPDPTNVRLMQYSIVICGVCWVMVPATYAITALVPVKKRVYGTRQIRFPYRSVGIALYLLAAFAGIYAFLDWILDLPGDGTFYAIRILAALVPGGAYFLYVGRRTSEATLEQAVIRDTRPPVLYLRSFGEEDFPFVEMPGRDMKAYTTSPYLADRVGPTLEQYLSKEITKSIGPFIALGDPTDYLAPEGAARTYAEDSGWETRFEDYARRAACVLVQIGRSEGLRWELGWLRSEGLQAKVFLLSSPCVRARSWLDKMRWYVLKKLSDYQRRALAQKAPAWSEFAEVLRDVGYNLHEMEPVPGSVLTFDQKGDAHVITSGALEPAHFVSAMKQWIVEHQGPEVMPSDSDGPRGAAR